MASLVEWASVAVVGLIALQILLSVVRNVTRRAYRVPPRITFQARLINWALWPKSLFQIGPQFRPLTFEGLKKFASKKTKLTDFGDPWFEGAFKFALELVHQNGYQYSPLGKLITFDSFERRLEARLRVKAELKDFPQAKDTPLLPPVFVLGLPRTGTTFLHHLLSLDPTVRYPKTWELFDPARLPKYRDDPTRDAHKRRQFVQNGIKRIKGIVPHIEAIHEIGADEPEECLIAIGMDMPLIFCTMPAYMSRLQILKEWDLTTAYANHYETLQLMAFQQSSQDKRWCLKCPMHLGFIRCIQKVFPQGTKIVWTHRDPCESIPSLSSLFQTMLEMHTLEDIRVDEVGQTTLKFWSEMLKRADEDIKSDKSGHSHVQYRQLIKDPISVVKQLYQDFGWEFTREYEQKLEEYIAENKKKREEKAFQKGKALHKYSLEQYGLTKEAVHAEVS